MIDGIRVVMGIVVGKVRLMVWVLVCMVIWCSFGLDVGIFFFYFWIIGMVVGF